ncbi:unnamed protein product [Plutella xylostella]|uniref:(diamondback moth) hypothetical protein n=1 Tax=Plutella xylostella TaxID=51655 RepID=A0A8S4FDR2_PLUXY|nr:unnamed protein product [Plutella xylostella]
MDSLVGYGSDEDHESERYEVHNKPSVSHGGGGRRRDDDTNYDDVNMDMSEDSQAESEPELPPAEPAPRPDARHDDGKQSSGRSASRERSSDKRRDERDRRRDDRARRERPDRPDKPERYNRSERERDQRRHEGGSRRGLLGDRPDDRADKIPPAVEARGSEPAPRSHDARDAVSPRFVDRDRRDRDRERERDRHGRRSEEKRGGRERYSERRSRSRSRESRERRAAFPPPEPPVAAHSSGERRISPATTDYRPSSYKVNRKLEVMEKMGLQIKTPDGSMATAQQLRRAACDAPPAAAGAPQPSFFNAPSMHANKALDQVQKRKLLWSGKNKSPAEEAAKWSGARFAQDNDGKQVSKFMRLMGIKEPAAVKPEAPEKAVDPIKKQEELFQAMQQQYEVARAATHTMRGVGLGFQRGQF